MFVCLADVIDKVIIMEKSQDLLSKCETFFIFNPDLFDSKDDEKKNNVLAIKCVMCVMIMNIQNQFSMININHDQSKKIIIQQRKRSISFSDMEKISNHKFNFDLK